MAGRREVQAVLASLVLLLCGTLSEGLAFTNPLPDGSSATTITENTASGDAIFSALATDSGDDSLVTFTLQSQDPVSTGNRFSVSGQTINTVGTFDYETAADRSFTLTFHALNTADGTTATADLSVSVTDVNDNDPTLSGTFSGSVLEEQASTGITSLSISAADADPLDSGLLTFSIIAGGSPNFQIDSATGTVTTMQAIDYDTAIFTTFNPVVRVEDSGGRTATETLTITLTPSNDNDPVFSQPLGAGTLSIPESTSAGEEIYDVLATDGDKGDTLTYSITAQSPSNGKFTITGQTIKIAAGQSFDYEVTADRTYDLTIRAQDSGGTTTDVNLQVQITDVNDETPTLNAGGTYVGTIAEESASSTGITSLSYGAADTDAADATLTYSFIAGGSPKFQIHATTGVITTNQVLDYDATTVRTFNPVVKVVDTATPAHSVTQAMTITLTATNDNAPVFSQPPADDTGTHSIPENTAAGEEIYHVLATDDDGDSLTYTITAQSPSNGKFTISGQTISIATGKSFDYEVPADRTYDLTIRADDGAGPTTDVNLQILITDVNDETPTINAGGTFVGTIAEESAINTAITSLSYGASDTDAADGALTYSFIAGGSPKFQIHATTGVITTAQVLDYDTATVTTFNPVVKVVDTATPAHSVTLAMTITLTATNDNSPVFSQPPADDTGTHSIPENTAAGEEIYHVLATDGDGDSLTYSITAQSPSNGKFTISGQTISIATGKSFDYEVPADRTYDLTIRADDGAGPTTDVNLQILITDVNDETPTIDAGGTFVGTIAEESAINTAITSLSYGASDTDAADGILTYSFIAGGSPKFQIHATTGVITTAQVLDYDTATVTTFNPVVKVVDTATPAHSVTLAMTITLTATNDNAPVFSQPPADDTGTHSIPENTAAGEEIYHVLATDGDGDSLTYSITAQSPSNGKFIITGQTIKIAAGKSFDYEDTTDRTYDLTIRADDGAGPTTDVNLQILITDVNDETPTINAGGTFVGTIAEESAINTAITSLSYGASDTDAADSTLTYSFIAGGSPKFQIHATTGVITTAQILDYDTATVTTFNPVVKVVDTATPAHSVTQAFTITLTATNDNLPVFSQPATGGSTISIPETTQATTIIYDVLATDVDRDSPTYTITAQNPANGKFTISGQTISIAAGMSFDYEDTTDRSYTLTIRADDGAGSTTDETLTVTITDVNDETPTLTGTFSGTVAEESATGTAITGLVITGQDTDNGDTLTYSFIAGGPPDFHIEPTTGAVTTASVLDYDILAVTTFNPVIMVVDSASPYHSATQTLTIDVTPINDNNPVFYNPRPDGSTRAYLAEDSPGGSTVLVMQGTDADGDTITYSLLSQSPTTTPVKFTVNSQTVATALDASFDFEDPADMLYTLIVHADDGSNTATAVLTVQITGVVDETPVIGGTFTGSLAEEDAIGTQITVGFTVTDTDTTDTLSYSFIAGGANFHIDALNGIITTAAVVDYEAGTTTFNPVLKVSDAASNTATQTLTITLTAVNDNTPVFTPNCYTGSVAENTAGSTNVVTVTVGDLDSDTVTVSIESGDDASAKFQVSGNGIETTATATDYETKSKYTLIVVGKDGGTPENTGTATVVIEITGVNEADPAWDTFVPAYTDATTAYDLAENTPIGATIVTVAATDADSANTADGQVTYSLGAITANTGTATAGLFCMDPTTGELTTTSGNFDRETTESYSVTVVATDGGGRSINRVVLVGLTDYNDNAPTFDQNQYMKTITESATAGTSLLLPVASDLDTSATFTYQIATGDTTFFEFDGTTPNKLNLKAQVDLDVAGDAASYSLTITVKDGGSPELTGTAKVTVTVDPVNEHDPTFTSTPGGAISISESESTGYSVFTFVATDSDYGQDGVVTYSITTGNGHGKFAIDANSGKVELALKLDMESGTTSYTMNVKASDGGSPARTADTTLSITVTGANEAAPTCTDSAVVKSIDESAVATDLVDTLACTDPDTGDTLTYSIASGDTPTPTFQIDASGVITLAQGLNYETLTSYSLVIAVSDGSNVLSVPVTVNVNPINENTPAFGAAVTVSFAENTPVDTSIAQLLATDTDDSPHDITAYEIASVTNSGTSFFLMHQDSGLIELAREMDYEGLPAGAKNYVIVITATDGGGLIGTGTVTVSVTDYNDQRPACSPLSHVVQISEAIGTTADVIGDFSCSDSDGSGTLTYLLTSQAPSSDFALDVSGTPKLVVGGTALDYETTNAYQLTLEVSDGGSPDLTTTVYIDITLTDVNEAGPAFAGDLAESVSEGISIGTSVTDCDASAGEPDGANTVNGNIIYSLFSGNTDNKFAIDSATGRVSVAGALDRENLASYSIVVQAIEEVGTNSATLTLAITVTDVNDNDPTCTVLAFSQTILESATAATVIHPLVCSDADAGVTLTYTLTSGDSTYFEVSGTDFRLKAPIDYDTIANPRMDVSITVSDGTNSVVVEGSVTVLNVEDNPPVFGSGGTYTASVSEDLAPGTLITTVAATDGDGDVITYSGTFTLFTLDSSSGEIRLKSGLDRETAGTHTLSVGASDGTTTITATVTITVEDANDNTPAFTAASYSTTVAENTAVGGVLTVAATDTDLASGNNYGTIVYSIEDGNTGTYFGINSASGLLSTVKTLDYEVAESYSLKIHATDGNGGAGSNTATTFVTVIVGNDNEHDPVMGSTSYAATFSESTTVGTFILQVAATDADTGTDGELYFTMSHTKFYINEDTGNIYLKTLLDYEEATKVHTFDVTAHDRGTTSRTATAAVSVTVTDENDNTPSCSPDIYSNTFAEDTATSTAVATIACTDADSTTNAAFNYAIKLVNGAAATTTFAVSAAGAVTTNVAFDYETTVSYVVLIEVADQGAPSLSTTVTVNVAITDVNEHTPAFSGSPPFTANVAENSAVGTTVLTIAATDSDTADTITYSFSATTAPFTIDPTSGDVITTALLDLEAVSSYTITVKAEDSGTVPAVKDVTTTLTITVTNVNDNAPVFNPASYTVAVSENEAVGTTLTPSITATDADDATITYSIHSGDDASPKFRINKVTEIGHLVVDAALDYETTSSYALVVHAVDGSSLTGSTTVFVSVTGYNEATPVFTASAVASVDVAEDTAVGVLVNDFDATDTDSDQDGVLTYSIQSGDSGKFSIDPSTGEVKVADTLDRETTQTYTLVVRATDGGTTPSALFVDHTMTVTITDVNDVTPVCDSTQYIGTIGEDASIGDSVAQLACTDADNDPGGTNNNVNDYNIISGNTNTKFAVSNTGEVSVLAVLDRETLASYTLEITVGDAGTPILSTTTTVYITVTDANDNPPVFGSATYTFTHNENIAYGTSIGQVAATDADIDTAATIDYTIFSGNGDGKFSLDAIDGTLKVIGSLNYDATNAYVLEIHGTDQFVASPLTGTTTVSINLNDVNDHSPTCTEYLYTGTVAEDATTGTTVATVSCSDALDTGSTITYTLSGSTDFTVLANGAVTTNAALNIETTATYTLTVTASDGTLTTDVTVHVSLTDVNDNHPQFTGAPYTDTISEATAQGTTIRDLAATDLDVSATSFVFSITGGNVGTAFGIAASTGEIIVLEVLDRETLATYTLDLEVTDGTPGLTSSTSLVVTISDENDNYPGCDQATYASSIPEDTSVSTNVASPTCSDIDDSQTLLFTIVSGNGDGMFEVNGNTGVVKTVTGVTFDYETTTQYILGVSVSDQYAPTAKTTAIEVIISITAVNDNPPTFTGAPYTGSVSEDAILDTVVADVDATDSDVGGPDHATITFSIVSGDTNTNFIINPSTGVITVAKSLDREAVASYLLGVRATDGGGSTVDTTVTITVTDVNDNYPVFNPTFYTAEVLEDVAIGTIVKQVTATDADEGVAGTAGLAYTITAGDASGAFTVDGDNVKTFVDIAHGTNYVLTITAADSGTPPLSSTALLSIEVMAVNEYDPAFNTGDQTVTITEDTAPETSIYQVTGTDSDIGEYATIRYYITGGNTNDAFSLDPFTGIINVLTKLDYDTAPIDYRLTLEVHDTSLTTGSTRSTTRSLTVSLSDINDETPVFASNTYTWTLDENVGNSVSVNTVAATDADTAAGNGDVTYSIISGSGQSHFTIESATGIVRTSATIDYETNPYFELKVQAADGGTPTLSSTCLVQITIVDLNDNAPQFQVPEFTTTMSEDAVASFSVAQVAATDADSASNGNNDFEFSLVSGEFAVHATTGDITKTGTIDRENVASYVLNVVATDKGSNPATQSSTATITIVITDVNDNNPIVTGSYDDSIAEDTSINTSVFDITASDADENENGQLTYSIALAGDPNSDFRIDSTTGLIQVAKTLDRETTDVYYLVVTVADSGASVRSVSLTATVTITDVNDNDPVFSLTNYIFSVSEEVPVASAVNSVAATDADIGVNAALSFSIVSPITGDSNHFAMDAASGAITTSASLDRETTDTYVFQVQAIDGGTTQRSATATVTISILDFDDQTPAFDLASYSISTVEESAIGTSVFSVTITDLDIGVNDDITLSIDTTQLDGAYADLNLQVDSSTSIISVKQPLDRETSAGFSFYLVATDGGAAPLSSSVSVSITVEDINDNNPIFSPVFYNNEIAYNDTCQVTVATLTATDADTGVNAALTYYFTQNNHAHIFFIDATSGAVTKGSTAVTDTGYLMYAAAQDAGATPLTSTTGATIRVDTYDPNERVIVFHMEISRTAFLAIEATFLTNCHTQYQTTYATAQCRRWCVVDGTTSSTSKLYLYVIRDDTADDISETANPKNFLTSDEAYVLAAADEAGTPSSLFTGPIWTAYAIVLVERYYEPTTTSTPWIETQTGIIVVSVVSATAAVLIALGVAYGIYKCRKPKGGSPNKNRVEIAEAPKDKVAKNRYNNNPKRAPSRMFRESPVRSNKVNNAEDSTIQSLKQHPPPTVVALDMPKEKVKKAPPMPKPERAKEPERPARGNSQPRVTEDEVTLEDKKEKDKKENQGVKPMESLWDPQGYAFPYRASETAPRIETPERSSADPDDRKTGGRSRKEQAMRRANIVNTSGVPPVDATHLSPKNAPRTPSPSPQGRVATPRVAASETPISIPHNREFTGDYVDPNTGLRYSFNIATGKSEWIIPKNASKA